MKHPPIVLPEAAPERGPTKAQRALVPTVNIALRMPSGMTPANTCKGREVSPQLSWGPAPEGTTELVLFAVNVQPVDGKLHFDWAMAGLSPSMEGLEEGEVPEGSLIGRNGDGKDQYALCPSESGSETYIFSIYPVRKSLGLDRGFEPLAARKRATRLSDDVGLYSATIDAG